MTTSISTAVGRVPIDLARSGLSCALAVAVGCLAFPGPAAAVAPEGLANLHVTAATPVSITVAWDPPVSAHPWVEISLTGPAPGGTSFGGSGWNPAAISHTATELVCGSSYTLTAAWSDDPGQPSGPSSTVRASTASCTKAPPPAPSGLHATPSATHILFGWDTAPSAATKALITFAGPGQSQGEFWTYASSHDPRAICDESYTLTLRWLDDEGQTSPTSTLAAAALACPFTGEAGPAGLRVASRFLDSLVLAWDPYRSAGLWFPRTTLTGSGPYKYLQKSAVSDTVKNLVCGTSYTFAVQWVFLDGTVSEPSTLDARTAECALATVLTGDAATISWNYAGLQGSVTPNGTATSYYFDYGPTPSYGARTDPRDAGSGSTRTASGTAYGLSATTLYHYRLVAVNAVGTSYGTDRTFTTMAQPPNAIGPTPIPVFPSLPSVPGSTPRPSCTVPRLAGSRLRTARTRLKKANCVLGKVSRKHGRRSQRGKVIASKPGRGTTTTGKVALVVGT
jgi:hypothetical protein